MLELIRRHSVCKVKMKMSEGRFFTFLSSLRAFSSRPTTGSDSRCLSSTSSPTSTPSSTTKSLSSFLSTLTEAHLGASSAADGEGHAGRGEAARPRPLHLPRSFSLLLSDSSGVYLTFGDYAQALANLLLTVVPLLIFRFVPEEAPSTPEMLVYCCCFGVLSAFDRSLEEIGGYYVLKVFAEGEGERGHRCSSSPFSSRLRGVPPPKSPVKSPSTRTWGFLAEGVSR